MRPETTVLRRGFSGLGLGCGGEAPAGYSGRWAEEPAPTQVDLDVQEEGRQLELRQRGSGTTANVVESSNHQAGKDAVPHVPPLLGTRARYGRLPC